MMRVTQEIFWFIYPVLLLPKHFKLKIICGFGQI